MQIPACYRLTCPICCLLCITLISDENGYVLLLIYPGTVYVVLARNKPCILLVYNGFCGRGRCAFSIGGRHYAIELQDPS